MRDIPLIDQLLKRGAELDCLNFDWKTPFEVFWEEKTDRPLTPEEIKFAKKKTGSLKTATSKDKVGARKLPSLMYCAREAREVCNLFPIYLRYQAVSADDVAVSWVPTGYKTSNALYHTPVSDGNEEAPGNSDKHFLESCNERFMEMVGTDVIPEVIQPQEKNIEVVATKDQPVTRADGVTPNSDLKDEARELESKIGKKAWRWINFPSNNVSHLMTLGRSMKF